MLKRFLKNKTKDIPALIKDVQESETKDFHAMFVAYYQLGKAYYENEQYEHALHYLNRADSLSMSLDDLHASDDDIEQCSNMIRELENKKTLFDTLLREIDEKAENLNYDQRSLWNLLTLCRMETLLKAFGELSDCEILKRIPHIIDLLYQIIVGEIEYDESEDDFLDELYALSDSNTFYDPQTTISLPCLQQPIQLLDFIGGDVITSLNIFVDHEFYFTDISEFTNDFVASALGTLKSYYIRTQDQDILNIPQIQNEMQRIRDDFDFIINIPEEDEFIQRMNAYRQLNIFA